MYLQKRFAKCCCLLFLLTSFTPPIFSQELPAAADQDHTAAKWADYAISRVGADSRLYNGLEYIRNGTAAKGFPFFDVDSLRTGTFFYDGLLFRHIPMEYDLVEDKVIIPDYTGKALISLISEKLSYFSIGGRRFRYVDVDKTTAVLHKPGFYEELYTNGPAALLARREKKLILPTNREEQARYDQHNSYFLLLDNRFFPIDGERDLLDALKDKKEALKQYIRAHKIRFGKNLESALIQTTDYYLQIRH